MSTNAELHLPECSCRHDWDVSTNTFFCAHPKVHSVSDLVTASVCRGCKRWKEPPPKNRKPYPNLAGVKRDGPCLYLGKQTGLEMCQDCRGDVQIKIHQCDHPEHDKTDLRKCKQCVDYESGLGKGDVSSWAVGVTTAPRESSTIRRTLQSLSKAGFDDVQVFAEPGSATQMLSNEHSITQRNETLGAFPNWYLALAELLMRKPNADAYMMVQDDVVMCQGVREYLESILWPTPRVGFVSIYRSAYYGFAKSSLEEVDLSLGLMGALALVFPNSSVRALLSDRQVIAHRLHGKGRGLQNIDDVVASWSRRAKFPGLVHYPSLAQHIGTDSAIWPESHNEANRRASDFVGEDWDARLMVPGSVKTEST